MQFKNLKELIRERAKNNNACSVEFKKLLETKTKKQLLKLIKNNAVWCFRYTDTINVEILDLFGVDLCKEVGIYYKCYETMIRNKKDLLFLGNFKCELLDNSTVTEMWDNSTVTKMWDNSTVTKMFDNSTVTKMFGNSTVTKMLGNSTVTKMLGNSTVTKMLGNSTVTKMLGNSTVTEMFDNSTVKIPCSVFASKFENIKKQHDNSQVIDINNKKIYIVKSKFKIIEV